MKVRVVQAETGGRSSFSQAFKDKLWLAAYEGGRQRLRAKTNCDCGFVKSSVDAKGNTLDMHTKQRLQSTAHICGMGT